ncbi:MAG: tRNA epoxyqueuosine(34) reductase QueG [Acidobacteriota bacterium]
MTTTLAEALKGYALGELGVALVGIADASPLEDGDRLTAWLAEGAHGDMEYMARTAAVRRDPQLFLPGARSVVVVAVSYRDEVASPTNPPAGAVTVARYARRRDYHDVIRRRLVRLGRWLVSQLPGCRWRVGVDTAPLAERELARRAGLGWIGKNTCLINRRLGSELLLGALVTDAELTCDGRATSHCGRCTACLDACPTAALVRPGFLDARRCISYLTIEHRSPFQPWQARAIGNHLAGCDICQQVCPFNRRAPRSCDPALPPRPHLQSPAIGALSRLDESGWRQFAAGTPLRRLDFARFARNLEAIGRNGEANPPRPPACPEQGRDRLPRRGA